MFNLKQLFSIHKMDAGLKVMQEKRALCAMNPHHNLSAFLPIFFSIIWPKNLTEETV